MRVIQKRAVLALCSVALAALSIPADAKPAHHKPAHHKPAHQRAQIPAEAPANVRDDRYPLLEQAQPASRAARGSRKAMATTLVAGGFGSSSLVAEARNYLGTNPTGRGSLWCGAFMDMVLKRTGHAGGGNLARAYSNYGTRVAGPQVGAIAVMGRNGGGHVGVVSGVDPNGNPIIISGNHNRTVAESVYPRGRIIAYVLPGG